MALNFEQSYRRQIDPNNTKPNTGYTQEEALNLYRAQNKDRYWVSDGKGGYRPGSLYSSFSGSKPGDFRNVNRVTDSTSERGLPLYVGGRAQLILPNGQTIDIANPIAQKLQFQQNREGYAAKAQMNMFRRPSQAKYQSYETLRYGMQRPFVLDKRAANPNQAMNRGYDKLLLRQQGREMYDQARTGLSKPRTERRNAAGQLQTANIQKGYQEQAKKGMDMMSRAGNIRKSDSLNWSMGGTDKLLQDYRPTESNVRIKEKINPISRQPRR